MSGITSKKCSFEKLFQDNYTRLYYHALSFLNDQEMAKDVVNDVFEYIWTHHSKYEISPSILPFLYSLVRNFSVNQVRRQKAWQRYLQHAVLDSEFTEDNYQDYENLVEKLRLSVEELPSQTKVVFKKCFFEGKKYLEVGEELNISVNTVKTHVTKALRLLRERFTNNQLLLFLLYKTKK